MHSNHFDVDIFFYKKAHNLNMNDKEILYHINNINKITIKERWFGNTTTIPIELEGYFIC